MKLSNFLNSLALPRILNFVLLYWRVLSRKLMEQLEN